MNMYPVEDMVMTGMKIVRGRILEITGDGQIWVENDPEGPALPCDFLRTGAAPPPMMRTGDSVLVFVDEMGIKGYVLGLIQKYESTAEPSGSEISLAGARDKIIINANERIELRCGKSSMILDKEGRVVVKGTNITNRASGCNKIKGGTVQIN